MLRNWYGTLLILVIVSVISFFATLFFLNTSKTDSISHDITILNFGATLKSKSHKWCLGCKRKQGHTKRAIRIEFEVPESVSMIVAHVSGGGDNTGDKCVMASLHDPADQVLTSQKLCSSTKNFKTIRALPTMIKGKHYLFIYDKDTSLTGKSPGNGGKYKIVLKK